MKTQYLQTLQTHRLPLFLQAYWLDAVCGEDNWQPILSFDKAGTLRGAMSLFKKKKYGKDWIIQPLLTPFSGIWFNYPDNLNQNHKKIAFENDVMSNLIAQLPKAFYYNLQFQFSLQNAIPFHWEGFQISTRYTYNIAAGGSLDEAFQGVRDYVRTNVRKGEKTLQIETSDDIELFFRLTKNSVERSGTPLPYDLDFMTRLDNAVKTHGERHLLFAKDENNDIHAGIYFVCDHETVYYLASGMDERFKGVATTALIWEGIKLAKNTNRAFDFEGSMLKHIEPSFRVFNGDLRPYLAVKKAKYKWIELILRALGRF